MASIALAKLRGEGLSISLDTKSEKDGVLWLSDAVDFLCILSDQTRDISVELFFLYLKTLALKQHYWMSGAEKVSRESLSLRSVLPAVA